MRIHFIIKRRIIFIFFTVLILTACNKDKNNQTTSRPITNPVAKPHEGDGYSTISNSSQLVRKGMFTANLVSMNSSVGGYLKGTATFIINEDDFSAEVQVTQAGINTIHGQYIQTGKDCPNSERDENGDSLVDFEEGLSSFGKILIPLDGDINSQLLDSYIFPASDVDGNYVYTINGTLSQMMDDLASQDEDTEDDMVKITDKKLDLTGKVVVIYGVPADSKLPSTIASFGNFAPYASLPIACGRITHREDSSLD